MKLEEFNPYSKQKNFLNTQFNKVLFGGNRVGKSLTLAYEAACHATGIYPDWWYGIRFNRPVNIIISGETVLRTRDTVQEKLTKNDNGLLDGFILEKTKMPAIKDAINTMKIKHASGGASEIQFMSNEMGKDKWAGINRWADVFFIDERHDLDLMEDILISGEIVIKAMTPLQFFESSEEAVKYFNRIKNLFNDNVYHISIDDSLFQDKQDLSNIMVNMNEDEFMARYHGEEPK